MLCIDQSTVTPQHWQTYFHLKSPGTHGFHNAIHSNFQGLWRAITTDPPPNLTVWITCYLSIKSTISLRYMHSKSLLIKLFALFLFHLTTEPSSSLNFQLHHINSRHIA